MSAIRNVVVLGVSSGVMLAGALWADSGKAPSVYGSKCASCHGKDAKGNLSMAKMFKLEPAALNLVDEATMAQTDKELIATVTKGKNKMPVFEGKLSEKEIADLIAYLRGLGGAKPKAKAVEKADGGPGAKLFESKCASCHGKDGKGKEAMAKMFKVEPAALNLIDEPTLAQTDEELIATTTKGKNKMPAFEGKLSSEDLAVLVSYLRELGGGKPKAAGAGDMEAGAKLYDAKCASCHGKDGKGKEAMAKMFKLELAALDVVDEASLSKSDKELFDLTADGINKMPGYKEKLQAEEIDAVIAYIRSLAPVPAKAAPEEEAKPEGGEQAPEGEGTAP
ncbi:MAG: c-type cytochrome [Elusimicrobia bacterium]|nr:c-type cytochrome [Elusimicrobiota bacterium]